MTNKDVNTELVTYQTSDPSDIVNPIGRIWGAKIEGNINLNTKSIDDISVELQGLLNLMIVPGELRWMHPDVKVMPSGWRRVDIKDGYTLTQNYSGVGEVISHTHQFNPPKTMTNFLSNDNSNNLDVAYGESWSWTPAKNFEISSTGSKINKAAGYAAVLWIYDPNNEFE